MPSHHRSTADRAVALAERHPPREGRARRIARSLIVCLLPMLSPTVADAEDAIAAPQDPSTLLPAPKLSIDLRPGRAWPGTDHRLSAEIVPPRKAVFRWTATDGSLLSNDEAEVWWEAPERPAGSADAGRGVLGEVRIRVEARLVGSRAAPLVAERTVAVLAPSTRGMARVPGGLFIRGDTWTDVHHPDFVQTSQNMADKPPHPVKLSAFWIDRQRVTHEQYARFLQAAFEEGLLEVTPIAVLGPQRGGGRVPYFRFSYDDLEDAGFSIPPLYGAIRWEGERFVTVPGKERHPAVDVTWAGADAFARYHGKRLPTEAQWEFAARGTDGRRFPWGNELPTPRHANLNHAFEDRLFPVGTFSPHGDSPFGVQELVGGVFEWVHDWYDDRYYADHFSTEPLVDPRGPHWGKDRVIRGLPATYSITGSDFEASPVTFRYAWILEVPIGAGFASAETGFRCALDESLLGRRPARENAERDAGSSDHAPFRVDER